MILVQVVCKYVLLGCEVDELNIVASHLDDWAAELVYQRVHKHRSLAVSAFTASSLNGENLLDLSSCKGARCASYPPQKLPRLVPVVWVQVVDSRENSSVSTRVSIELASRIVCFLCEPLRCIEILRQDTELVLNLREVILVLDTV